MVAWNDEEGNISYTGIECFYRGFSLLKAISTKSSYFKQSILSLTIAVLSKCP